MSKQKPNPFAHITGNSILQMGLNPITDSDWIAPYTAKEYHYFQQHKRSWLAQDENEILVDNRATRAIDELEQQLRQHLQKEHEDTLRACKLSLTILPSASINDRFEALSLWVPDDICILQPATEIMGQEIAENLRSEYLLTALSVMSPSLWSPKEKFMQPLTQIHAPLPGYTETLMPSVNRFFHHLKPGMPVVRFNGSIQENTTLNRQPKYEPEVDANTPLYFRSERQTLLRLPASKAVVFFIRTQLYELTELSHYGVSVKQLLSFFDAIPESEKAYKGISKLAIAMEKYLS